MEKVTKLISISEKNKKVIDILNSINKNKQSEYICQAIIEKYERENNTNTDIKSAVKAILEEMVGNQFIIYKANQEISIPTVPVEAPQKEYIEPNFNDDESTNLILGALDNWDEE